MTVDDILVGYIFTLTYVNRHPNRDFHTKARKSRFCVKREALTVSTLRMQGFVKKAERAV